MEKKTRKPKLVAHKVYSEGLLTRKVFLPITAVTNQLQKAIEDYLKFHFEGKCIVEGYLKPGSIKLHSYSSGVLHAGNMVQFEVVFECELCFPVENKRFQCIAKNITKAGIRAISATEDPSPIVVFIAKEHHTSSAQAALFHRVKEGDTIMIRVIGQRFYLDDKYISVIAELVPGNGNDQQQQPSKKKQRIVLEDDEPDENVEVTYEDI